jgi:HlyD family secretion protein
VGSQVSGIIQNLYADYNSPVKKGQLLATLDPTPFKLQVQQRQADLQQAQVQMRNAEVQYNRSARLLEEQLVPEADFDTAKANFEGMKAQVDQAEASSRDRRLTLATPTSIPDRRRRRRPAVTSGRRSPRRSSATLFTIAEDLTKMQVQADVDQSDISRVATGQTARFTVDGIPADVRRDDPADPQTRRRTRTSSPTR